MVSSEHSTLVSPWLTEAEARVLQSAIEVLRELEERAGARLHGQTVADVRTAALLHESAKITGERVRGFLISMQVYGESRAAEQAIARYLAGPTEATS